MRPRHLLRRSRFAESDFRLRVELPTARAADLKWFVRRTGLALPSSLREFFRGFQRTSTSEGSITLLTLWESKRMLDSWPRFGFSTERGYVPIAEDTNGDLYCVCCRGPERGRVFHLAWAGDEVLAYPSVEQFVQAMVGDTQRVRK